MRRFSRRRIYLRPHYSSVRSIYNWKYVNQMIHKKKLTKEQQNILDVELPQELTANQKHQMACGIDRFINMSFCTDDEMTDTFERELGNFACTYGYNASASCRTSRLKYKPKYVYNMTFVGKK